MWSGYLLFILFYFILFYFFGGGEKGGGESTEMELIESRDKKSAESLWIIN
jgi:hypothetical protein